MSQSWPLKINMIKLSLILTKCWEPFRVLGSIFLTTINSFLGNHSLLKPVLAFPRLSVICHIWPGNFAPENFQVKGFPSCSVGWLENPWTPSSSMCLFWSSSICVYCRGKWRRLARCMPPRNCHHHSQSTDPDSESHPVGELIASVGLSTRPITNLSPLYSVYGSARFEQLSAWRDKWLPNCARGARKNNEVHDISWHIALAILNPPIPM